MNGQPLIVTVAPNGARRTRADHPRLPITPAELAAAAAACREAGAAMIHLHVRDGDGRHTLDVGAYRSAISAIREAVGTRMIIQVTTEAAGLFGPAEQMAMVRALRPEAVSVAVRELCADAGAERTAARFYGWAWREGIALQHILYGTADVTRFSEMRRRGIVPGDLVSALYVLGSYNAGRVAVPADLLPFLYGGAHNALWTVCAFGPLEAACAVAAASLGGHVRVGFENNLLLSDGTRATDNSALVRQIASLARGFGRALANADDARALMGAR